MYNFLNFTKKIIFVFFVSVLFGCEDFVQNVDGPIDTIPDEELSQEENLQYLLTGVKGSFAETHDQISVQASGLSDEQVFDRDVPQATFPSYDRLDRGDFTSEDGTINNQLGEFRFMSDFIIERIDEMEISAENEELANEARFFGNFFGGISRSWYALYMGLEPNQGGGIIDNGPFIPSQEMFGLALEKLETCRVFVQSPYWERVLNSVTARIHLYNGNYLEAKDVAKNGLQPGDDPFNSEHNTQSSNAWYSAAGNGRVQWIWNERFLEYIDEEPAETVRLPSQTIEGRTGQIHYFQDLYPERSSSIRFISWQENNLMLAELELREGSSSAEDTAKNLINEVRESYGLTPYTRSESINMDVILKERDIELFTEGQRLVDQRRFDLWHLAADSWRYFPFSDQERNNNPNL